MKLGTETGSLINHVIAAHTPKTPAVGDGATLLMWTDRSPLTVVAVEGGMVYTTEDSYERTDANGMSDSQRYKFTTNLDGRRTPWKLDKSGKWRQMYQKESGRWCMVSGAFIAFGRRERYHDFSF